MKLAPRLTQVLLPPALRSDPATRRRAFVLVGLGLGGGPTCLAFAAQQWTAFGSPAAAATLAIAGIGLLATPLLLRCFRSPVVVGHALMGLLCLTLGAISYLRGGLIPNVMMWALLVPPSVVLMSERGTRVGILWAGLILVEIVTLRLLMNAGLPGSPPRHGSGLVGLSALLVATTVIAIGYDIGRRTRQREQRELEQRLARGEKLESVGRLAAGIAHDFNNLLTVIRGHVELAKRSTSDDIVHDDLLRIDEAAMRGAQLTTQLLAFGGKGRFQSETFPIDDAVTEVRRLMERVLPANVDFTVTPCARGRCILANEQEFQHVLINLVLNARDAMPDGGRLIVRTETVTLGAAAADADVPPGDYVLVEVRDTGHGMDEETRARIFEPFFTTKFDSGGTGLGLASAYGIVRKAGGDLTVDSTQGRGSSFRVYLPTADAPGSAVASPPVPSRPPERHATILLVEDEPAVRRATARLLANKGYSVLVADDGARALEIEADHDGPIDLLLTDVIMPRLPGHEVARALRRNRPGLHVVYMSGYSDVPEILEQARDGQALVLHKPYEPQELLRQVREILGAAVDKTGAVERAEKAG